MQCVLQGGRVLRRVLRRGSKKGLSRRHLEGRRTPLREYDPVGVRPLKNERCFSHRTRGDKFRGIGGEVSDQKQHYVRDFSARNIPERRQLTN